MDPTTRPYLGVVEAIEVLPDGDPLLRREPHRIARSNAEDVEERVGIAQRLCPAHYIGRVRVGSDEQFQRRRADLDAPGGRGGSRLLTAAGCDRGSRDAAEALCCWPIPNSRAAYAFCRPPRSAPFSITVICPLTNSPGATSIAEYCAARVLFSARNRCRSSSVHQSRRFPAPSNCDPPRSNPWVISWPMIWPMPPRLDAASASWSKNGGCRMLAGKNIVFSGGM